MYRILIAAEKKKEYQLMRRLLEQLSEPVEVLPCAGDTASFIQRLSSCEPDLIITDVRLSGSDDFKPMEYVRYKKCQADVVIVTACTEFSAVRQALRFGAADYLKKPLDERELLDCVQRLLRDRAEQISNQRLRGESGTMYRNYLRMAEKEFMQSLLLKIPDISVLHEIAGNTRYFAFVMAADGFQDGNMDAERMEQLENQVFLSDICLKYQLDGVLYLFILCDSRECLTGPETEKEWLRSRADDLLKFLQEGTNYVRIGVSQILREDAGYVQGLEQARSMLKKLSFTGIGIYEENPVLFSRQEAYYVDKALAYMEQNYGEKLRLEDVAGEVGVTGFYLSRLFSKVKQQTFSELLTDIRIRHALLLLREGGRHAEEVSELCGYSNVNYFYKVLKKQTGMTVREIQRSGNRRR